MSITKSTDIITGEENLSVLLISTSAATAAHSSDTAGGVQYRLCRYGEHLNSLTAIVRTFRWQKDLHTTPFTLSNKVRVLPTSSYGQLAFLFDAYRLAIQLIRYTKFDVIVVQDASVAAILGFVLKARFSIPVSVTVYGDHINNPTWLQEGHLERVNNQLAKWVLRQADSIRVDSELVKRRLTAMGISAERIWSYPVFIRNIETLAEGDGTAIRRRFNIGEAPLVLFVGRLVAQKNVPNLLDAFAYVLRQVPTARCLIVGDGPEEATLKSLTTAKGLDGAVIFAGAAEYTTLRDYYTACNVLVLPSNYEGIARVLIEASAAARPIVATDVGGTSEIVADKKTGLLVPAGDSVSLANALCKILLDHELAVSMGERARKRVVNTYTEEQLIPQYVNVWRQTALMAKASTEQ